MEKRIKVFLGAYLNQSNAQNLNCKAIATYIDRRRFIVTGLQIGSGNFGKIRIPGVKLFTCYFPAKLTRFLGYAWGIYNCDIAFLQEQIFINIRNFYVEFLERRALKQLKGSSIQMKTQYYLILLRKELIIIFTLIVLSRLQSICEIII